MLKILIIRELDWKGINLTEQFRIKDIGIPDIGLKNNNYLKAIVEAKKSNQDLEIHKEQLYQYVTAAGTKLGVLTNGYQWWFYLPWYKDQWRFKKFLEIDIINSLPSYYMNNL